MDTRLLDALSVIAEHLLSSATETDQPEHYFRSAKEAQDFLGVDKNKWSYLRRTDPDFPAPTKLGTWRRSDLEEYLK